MVAACYQPTSETDCAVTCETAAECPSDFVCTRNRCAATAGACDSDGGVDPDGSLDGVDKVCTGDPAGLLASRCFVPAGPVTLASSPTLNTDSSPLCSLDPTVQIACFVVGTSITVPGLVEVIGSRPLVLWSATDIDISGTLDAGSHLGGLTGPAANPASCDVVAGGTNATTVPIFGGGGGGGSNNNLGGTGGTGRVGTIAAPTPGQSDLAAAALRGGCPGGSGGFSPGTSGAGGGVVYLMAHGTIRISGVVNASGAGGGPGTNVSGEQSGGGGGGGSGGLIGLDAAMIVYDTANVVALGGGGGSGANEVMPGVRGTDVNFTLATQATGGQSTALDNIGGAGSSRSGGAAGAGGSVTPGFANNNGGGGGGGGGAGYILEFGTVSGAATSNIVPPPGP
jgi:hypothetical protein